jgi:hypothetical protein
LKECRTALGLQENDSLRVAMNNEYQNIANRMTKEKIFSIILLQVKHNKHFAKACIPSLLALWR